MRAAATPLERERAERCLANLRRLCCAEIARRIADRNHVQIERMLGATRGTARESNARCELIALMHSAGLSHPEIAAALDVDHTTSIYGVRRHEWRMRVEHYGELRSFAVWLASVSGSSERAAS